MPQILSALPRQRERGRKGECWGRGEIVDSGRGRSRGREKGRDNGNGKSGKEEAEKIEKNGQMEGSG